MEFNNNFVTEGICYLCEAKGPIKHLPIYVSGSEGICVCLSCADTISEIIRRMKNVGGRTKRQFMKDRQALKGAD